MRTTGLRRDPLKLKEINDDLSSCTTHPETKIALELIENTTVKEHPNVTLRVISESIPPREGLAKEISEVFDRLSISSERDSDTSASTPPRKPPRTFNYRSPSPKKQVGDKQETVRGESKKGEQEENKQEFVKEKDTEEKEEETEQSTSHPGPPITPTALYLLKRLGKKLSSPGGPDPVSDSLICSSTDDLNTSVTTLQLFVSPSDTLTPVQPKTNPDTTVVSEPHMAFRNLRRRILAEDTPPPPSTPPPLIPSTTSNANPIYPPLPVTSDTSSSTWPSHPTVSRPTQSRTSPPSTQTNGNAGVPHPPNRSQSNGTPQASTRPRQLIERQAPVIENLGTSGDTLRPVSLQVHPPSSTLTLDQGPITNAYEFEGTCKQIFQLQRNARSLMDQNQYNKTSNDGEMSPTPSEGALSTSSSTSGTLRELLRIREGVKIFFIHDDGVITSPWNRPFLSVAKDPSKSTLGQSLLMRVGKSLWFCELESKVTMVFKSEGSTYLFKETNNKPDCITVAIRVPSSVRKVQHDLLLRILQQHSKLEEERPSGITKSFSKGAATAATRVNKIVVTDETNTNQAFFRRNSMRALKGVSRGLKTLAQKTGATLPELPQEYNCLQDAANTLRFSRSARTVQYI